MCDQESSDSELESKKMRVKKKDSKECVRSASKECARKDCTSKEEDVMPQED
jgi:hypothetical protein